jgi:hypothetical protein
MSHPIINHIFVLSLDFLLNRIHENRVANTEIQYPEQAMATVPTAPLCVHERATHCPWASFQHGRQILAVLATAWAAFLASCLPFALNHFHVFARHAYRLCLLVSQVTKLHSIKHRNDAEKCSLLATNIPRLSLHSPK